MAWIKVQDLHEGMIVDLEGDTYADPSSDPDPRYEEEYSVVSLTSVDSDGVVLVTFDDGYQVGFPPDHELLYISQSSETEDS